MPRYTVTVREIVARTYAVEADDPTDAYDVVLNVNNPEDYIISEEWIDYLEDFDPQYDIHPTLADDIVWADNPAATTVEDTPDDDF